MKLIIGGATGFVGREVLRQALRSPHITSIITLGRRPITISSGEENTNKVTDIVMEDGENYSESIMEKFADADACIWYFPSSLSRIQQPYHTPALTFYYKE
jgi:hypothetical protein